MEINYELENGDYVDSSFRASKSNPSVFVLDVLVTFSLFIAGILCCIFGFEYFEIGALLIGSLVMGVLLIVLGCFYMDKRIYGWKPLGISAELAREKDAITLRLSEESLEYETLEDNSQVAWKLFSNFLEDDFRFLLIFRDAKVFLVVPKRAFGDEQQIEKARRYFKIITTSRPIPPPIAKPSE